MGIRILEAMVERRLIGDSGLQDVGTNDYDSQAGRSCRGRGGVTAFGPGKKDPKFTEKNFVRLLIFSACCFFRLGLLVPIEAPGKRFSWTSAYPYPCWNKVECQLTSADGRNMVTAPGNRRFSVGE